MAKDERLESLIKYLKKASKELDRPLRLRWWGSTQLASELRYTTSIFWEVDEIMKQATKMSRAVGSWRRFTTY